jgi:hypothetical protein
MRLYAQLDLVIVQLDLVIVQLDLAIVQLDLTTPFIFIANVIGVRLCTLKTGYINECCEFDDASLDRYTILRSSNEG